MRGDQIFTHDAAGDQMFLNDPFQNGRIALTVPGTIWVHDGNRSTLADAKTVRLGSQNAALFGELQFLQAPLQEIPRGEATLLLTAFRFRLIAAEKDMTPRDTHTDAGRDFSLGIGHAGSIFNACSAV